MHGVSPAWFHTACLITVIVTAGSIHTAWHGYLARPHLRNASHCSEAVARPLLVITLALKWNQSQLDRGACEPHAYNCQVLVKTGSLGYLSVSAGAPGNARAINLTDQDDVDCCPDHDQERARPQPGSAGSEPTGNHCCLPAPSKAIQVSQPGLQYSQPTPASMWWPPAVRPVPQSTH